MATNKSNFDREYHGLPSEIRLMIWKLLIPSEPIRLNLLTKVEQHISAATDPQEDRTPILSPLQQPGFRHIIAMLCLNHETRVEVQELYRKSLSFDFTLIPKGKQWEVIPRIAPMLLRDARSFINLSSFYHGQVIEKIRHSARGRKSLTLTWLRGQYSVVAHGNGNACMIMSSKIMPKIAEEVATGRIQEMILVCVIRLESSKLLANPRMAVSVPKRDDEKTREYKAACADRIDWSQKWMVLPAHGTEIDSEHMKDLMEAGVHTESIQGLTPTHVGVLKMKAV